eukprot:IDg22920t1
MTARSFSRPRKYCDREDRYSQIRVRREHEINERFTGSSGSDRDWSPEYYQIRRLPGTARIAEIIPSDPRFSDLVSWRRYRLNDRNSDTRPDISQNVGLWTHRLMSVMDKHMFNGKKPVACLRFLTAYKRALDEEGISEGSGLRIWPSFLKDSAYDTFTQMLEDG